MSEEEIKMVAVKEEVPPPTPEGVSVAWEDLLVACTEMGLSITEGTTVEEVKKEFLDIMSKVPEEEEDNLSELVVNVQVALADGMPVVGGPEEKKGKGKGKKKKEKTNKQTTGTKKDKTRPIPEGLRGTGINVTNFCKELIDAGKSEEEIKKEITQIYVEKMGRSEDYGMDRANKIYYTEYRKKFGTSPPRPEKPKKEKVEKPTGEGKKRGRKPKPKPKPKENLESEDAFDDVPTEGETTSED